MKLLSVLILITIYPHIYAQNISALFEQVDPSVVTIKVIEFKIKNRHVAVSGSMGSGIIISADGLVLTAAHVVESANEVSVKLQNGKSYQADVLSSSDAADVALLKLRAVPSNIKAVKIGNSDNSKIGDKILIIGSPLGLEHSLSVGYISRKMKKNVLTNGEMAGFIQTDASINQGNSGGPMINTNGELIGIVSFMLSKSGGFDGLGFAVDINTIKKTLFDVNSFWTGFDGLFLSEVLAGVLNLPQRSGILIQHVTPNSFANKIGIKPGIVQGEILGQKLWFGGDIILSIQGYSCNAPHDLGNIKQQIENLKVGDNVVIKVLRKGRVVKLEANYIDNL